MKKKLSFALSALCLSVLLIGATAPSASASGGKCHGPLYCKDQF
ncbi:hypothetical protein [Solibacillus cecembensis]